MKESPFSNRRLEGFPVQPEPHVYILNEGGTATAPADTIQPDLRSVPLYPFDGTPLSPVGNPLLASLGPGAWVMRRDAPMLTEEGDLLLRPMRLLPLWPIGKGDADPRGMRVFDWRWVEVGIVRDCWIDQGIKIIRPVRGGGRLRARAGADLPHRHPRGGAGNPGHGTGCGPVRRRAATSQSGRHHRTGRTSA